MKLPKVLGCLYFLIGIIVSPCLLFSEELKYIEPEEALSYLGQTVVVCGKVVKSTYAVKSKGKPTFLNLNKAFPNQVFTIVIWGNHRNRFSFVPEKHYLNKDICVTGLINSYKNKAQIAVNSPSQIFVKKNDTERQNDIERIKKRIKSENEKFDKNKLFCGMTKKEVFQIFGKPTSESYKRLYYGTHEVWFNSGGVVDLPSKCIEP